MHDCEFECENGPMNMVLYNQSVDGNSCPDGIISD